MTSKSRPYDDPIVYQIRLKGHLPDHWSDWFDGMALTLDAKRGETLLTGPLVDQAALHGLLNKVRRDQWYGFAILPVQLSLLVFVWRLKFKNGVS